MRILLVHKYFHHTGGAEVFFFEVGRILAAYGHKVAYFSTNDDSNLESEYSRYFITAPDFKGGSVLHKVKQFLPTLYNLKAKKQFKQLIDVFRPEIIHIFNIMTQISPSILSVSQKRGIPVVISCNDYKHICPNYKLFHHGRICEECKGGRFYKCVLNRCSHDSLSFSLASSIESYFHQLLGVYTAKVNLFLFASDFMAQKTREFWDMPFKSGKLLNPYKIPKITSPTQIGTYGLYFGRLIEEKGVDVLIEALGHAPGIPFKIVGDGPDLEKLKRRTLELNLPSVEFLGPKWGTDLDDILKGAKFTVVPSIWHENFPYVVLQSFAAKKPVIGTNRGGIPEMVLDGERGLIYNATDPRELAEKMKELFANRALCVRMGENGRKYLEDNFQDDRFYNDLITHYNVLLK